MRKYLLALAALLVVTSALYTVVLATVTQPFFSDWELLSAQQVPGTVATFVAVAIAFAFIWNTLVDKPKGDDVIMLFTIMTAMGVIGVFAFLSGAHALIGLFVGVALVLCLLRFAPHLRLRWVLASNMVVAATVVCVLSTTDRTLIVGATLGGLFLLRFIGDLPKAELETKKPGTKPASGS